MGVSALFAYLLCDLEKVTSLCCKIGMMSICQCAWHKVGTWVLQLPLCHCFEIFLGKEKPQGFGAVRENSRQEVFLVLSCKERVGFGRTEGRASWEWQGQEADRGQELPLIPKLARLRPN